MTNWDYNDMPNNMQKYFNFNCNSYNTNPDLNKSFFQSELNKSNLLNHKSQITKTTNSNDDSTILIILCSFILIALAIASIGGILYMYYITPSSTPTPTPTESQNTNESPKPT